MDHMFTCAWERLHGIQLSSLSPELQRQVMFDRRPGSGVLDLRHSLEAVKPRRRAA